VVDGIESESTKMGMGINIDKTAAGIEKEDRDEHHRPGKQLAQANERFRLYLGGNIR